MGHSSSIQIPVCTPAGREYIFRADFDLYEGRAATRLDPPEHAEIDFTEVVLIGGLAGKEELKRYTPDKFERLAAKLSRNYKFSLDDLTPEAFDRVCDELQGAQEEAWERRADEARDERRERGQS